MELKNAGSMASEGWRTGMMASGEKLEANFGGDTGASNKMLKRVGEKLQYSAPPSHHAHEEEGKSSGGMARGWRGEAGSILAYKKPSREASRRICQL